MVVKMTIAIDDLGQDIRDAYTYMRVLPDGSICGVHRLLFHWTVHIGIDWVGYSDRYCFGTEDMARSSLDAWDGNNDMPGNWHKHPVTGRCRNIKTGRITMEGTPEAGQE